MLNARERFIRALTFQSVDKIPLDPGGARKSTLDRWHKEGLPEGVEYHQYIYDLLGIKMNFPSTPPEHAVNTRMVPIFEEKVLKHENGHYIVQDWMGAITEISDEFDYTYIRNAIDFVTRKWHKFPVETREDWQEMKRRFIVEEPSRLPENFNTLDVQMANRDYPSRFYLNGPFWQAREWMGFENLCIAFIDDPELVGEMVEFWGDFGLKMLEKSAIKIPIDALYLSEDMAYKAHPMISPAMTREFLLPVYKKWVAAAKRLNIPIIDMDSDGYIKDLIPIWIEAGINVCDPIEVAAHNDIVEFREIFGKNIAYRGGIDKRAIAAGGKIMETEVRRVVEPLLKDGGFIPSCDHGVPHDISFQNFIDYTKLLAKLTGWL